MHELSIAVSLIELASDVARELNAERIDAVHIRLGPLAGVVEQALLFSFEVAAADTPAAGARLVIQRSPLIALCGTCHEEKTIANPQHLRCPTCGELTPELRSGHELQLVAVEVGRPQAPSGTHPDLVRSTGRHGGRRGRGFHVVASSATHHAVCGTEGFRRADGHNSTCRHDGAPTAH